MSNYSKCRFSMFYAVEWRCAKSTELKLKCEGGSADMYDCPEWVNAYHVSFYDPMARDSMNE